MTSRAVIALALLATACGSTSTGRTVGAPKRPKLPPADPEALVQFDSGMRALRLGGPEAYERAEPRLRKAVELDSKLWEGWYNLGVVYFEQGDDDAATQAFSQALKINAAHTPALLARAEAFRRAGDLDEARKDYEAALARDEENIAIHIRYASLLREAGKLDAALDGARDALRFSNDPSIHVELGLIYLAQGRDELAELVLRKALEANEKLPTGWNALALLSMARGRDQEAFERFDKATSVDPTYSDARFNKASVLMASGDYAAAKKELQAVVKEDPDDYGAQVSLGVTERGLGDHRAAKRTWERVVKDAPRRSRARGDALFNLAVLAMDFGDRDEKQAREALDRYLQSAPRRHSKRKRAQERLKELGQ